MTIVQDFIETSYKTKHPCCDEEIFVVNALEHFYWLTLNKEEIIHTLLYEVYHKYNTYYTSIDDINRYIDLSFSFLSNVSSELKKLYLMDIIRCCYHASSRNDFKELYTEIEKFLEIDANLSENLKYNLSLFDTLTQNNNIKDDSIIHLLHKKKCDIYEVFSSYLLVCRDRLNLLWETRLILSENIGYNHENHATLQNCDCFDYSSGNSGSEHSHVFYDPDEKYKAIRNAIKRKNEKSFQALLFSIIDEKQISDSQVYNKARISRQIFSNIRRDVNYIPKKITVISLCIALELDISKTTQLLSSCGYSLSEYIMYDRIISYCIIQSCYDIDEINTILLEFHLNPIGCSSS